ncbi:hypothetical protein GCM10007205_13520 [Oxalicibacterium flavum]|uniref:OmpA-like domain-containing protein n=1 Tax=Oxalicibacterium flavum TaxID=179467 RepID=A0A8J2UK75_9BURK|nr:OmpA family protein [Oxalicibacterium flavum]GGC05676.1 hypothetical protein GCM10007205_13520 [Oxalicibacterium flavum]
MNKNHSPFVFRSGLIVVAAACLTLASAFAVAQENTNPVLTPQEDRITDRAIHRDHGIYRDTQQRIKTLNDGGRRVADYHLSKAQCWLDVSFHEYSRNDRGGFPQAALEESQRILTSLEEKKDPGWETPLVNGAEKLRPDLWERYDALKKHAGFQCATQQTACAEVELVHAGNEIHDAGWRHAKPYVQIAEDLTGAAEQAAEKCAPPPAPPVAAPVKLTLSADALFRFDKSTEQDLLVKGREELDEMAEKLRTGFPNVKRLSVIGHTDRLGGKAYNQKLSESRANTVKAYLEQRGVRVPITAEGRGLTEQVKACEGVSPRKALIDCLQPNRRVEVIVHEDAQP